MGTGVRGQGYKHNRNTQYTLYMYMYDNAEMALMFKKGVVSHSHVCSAIALITVHKLAPLFAQNKQTSCVTEWPNSIVNILNKSIYI